MPRSLKLRAATLFRWMAALSILLTSIGLAGPAEAVSYRGQFVFIKGSTNINGILRWDYWDTDGDGVARTYGSWRSGSGSTQDSCEKGKGWLPSGPYDGIQHQKNYVGSLIFGMVWELDSKKCYNGTYRTELFIHSKQTPSNGQNCPGSQCWASANDYMSNGCIKLSSANYSFSDDIGDADIKSRARGGPGYGVSRYTNLVVVSGRDRP